MDAKVICEQIRSGKAGREAAIRAMYANAKLRRGVQKIISPSQDVSDLDDVFNLSLVQFMKNALKNPDLKIDNLYSYIFGIARNLWFQKLKARQKEANRTLTVQDDALTPAIDLQIIDTERRALLNKILAQTGPKCKEILKYWATGMPMKDIAKQMGYSSDVVARKKKFVCMQRLMKWLDDHPELKAELKEK